MREVNGNNPKIRALRNAYRAWHWGQPAGKVVHVDDELVPDVVGIGELREMELDSGILKIPGKSWLAYDPHHPGHRLHCVLNPEVREDFRRQMKQAPYTVSLQEVAESSGGDHARWKLPNVQCFPLGVVDAVIYFTHKKGDGPSEYKHDFGKELAPGVDRRFKGTKPVAAIDVSGRLWIVGGSYRCPLPGITG